MAFCPNCGTQIADNVAFCPSCGKPAVGTGSGSASSGGAGVVGAAYGAAPAPMAAQALPTNAEEAKGFLSSLFDLSFTNFVATKLIKVLFVLCIVISALFALGLAAGGFRQDTGTGLLMLVIVAPIVFLLSVTYARVLLELVIVVFRMAEHLAEIAEQGRRRV